jgi:hypothetical protein
MATGSYTMAPEPRPLASMLAEPATEYIRSCSVLASPASCSAHPKRTDHTELCPLLADDGAQGSRPAAALAALPHPCFSTSSPENTVMAHATLCLAAPSSRFQRAAALDCLVQHHERLGASHRPVNRMLNCFGSTRSTMLPMPRPLALVPGRMAWTMRN